MGKLSRLLPLLLPLLLLLLLLSIPPEREQAPPPDPPPSPDPIVQTIQPLPKPEPDTPTHHPVGECTITYYDACVLCCGKTDGITASGAQAVPYKTCAVDPSVIPLGSTVLVDFGDGVLRRYRAEDTGSCVGGNHIDICVSSHEKALELGVKQAEVWWEEEDKTTCEGVTKWKD